MPAARAPVLQDLEVAAKLAFPVSKAERSAAEQRRKARDLALASPTRPRFKKKASAAKKATGKAAKRKAAQRPAKRAKKQIRFKRMAKHK